MAYISIRITDEEKATLQSFAKLHNKPLSKYIKNSLFEQLQEEQEKHYPEISKASGCTELAVTRLLPK